ncbi:hypothetical protein ACFL1B_06145 [Nanoarchaeota archaeon]
MEMDIPGKFDAIIAYYREHAPSHMDEKEYETAAQVLAEVNMGFAANMFQFDRQIQYGQNVILAAQELQTVLRQGNPVTIAEKVDVLDEWIAMAKPINPEEAPATD